MPSDFITDPGLSTLPEVFDPATIGEHLGRALPDPWGGATIRDVRLQILQHHPGRRCTFEIAARTARGETSLIGKVYASDRSDVYRAMDAIRRSGFGPEHEFSIPEPLAYVPEVRLLLQEKVYGPRAELMFLTGDDRDRAETAARAAGWLARFHAIAPRSGCVATPTEHLASVERWSQRFAWLGEPFASQARRLADSLAEEAVATRTGDLCAGHGSYDCHQIILADGRTVTYDWDSYDVADPCRDMARFIVALQRLAVKCFGSIRALDNAVEVFLKTYRALSPLDPSANLAWYRALTCLRLAKYEVHRPMCSFPEGVEALLGEGLRILRPARALKH